MTGSLKTEEQGSGNLLRCPLELDVVSVAVPLLDIIEAVEFRSTKVWSSS